MKRNYPLKPSAAIQPYLKPVFPQIYLDAWRDLNDLDLAQFKMLLSRHGIARNKQKQRRAIQKAFRKPVEKLTLKEFQDYNKPNFHAPEYLLELWPQLTKPEQDLVKQLNEWAFRFPASFETNEEFLQVCAERLERFFGRKFRVQNKNTQARQRKLHPAS